MKTINEIAVDNELHPVQVSQWKGGVLNGACTVFEGGSSARKAEEESEKQRARLERKIGQLAVEVDWLRKKFKELGL